MAPDTQVGPALPGELVDALRLAFQHHSTDQREARVANALRLISKGEFDTAGVFVCRNGQQIQGAMICMPVAGASGLVWPPQCRPGPRRKLQEDALVAAGTSWLRQRGAKLGQSLLHVQESHLGVPLERNGFRHITSLWYLRHDLTPTDGHCSDRLVYRAYDSCDQNLFHRVLSQSYENTLDCPEVNGVRTIEEVVIGHRSQGRHDPSRWWLAWHEDMAVGVLLLTELEDADGWDLSYVGVVPEARRLGIGRELVQKALAETKAAGASQLTLSVDTRNAPAWNLYAQLGFEVFDQREVFLAVWV